MQFKIFWLGLLTTWFACTQSPVPEKLPRLKYNHPGLVVDLGVGLWAWPLPLDYDRDGDYDLLVSCPDKPYNGIWFFENTDGNVKMPVFKPAIWLAPSIRNLQISQPEGPERLLIPGAELVNFRENKFSEQKQIYPKEKLYEASIRANQWKYCDFDADSALDLIVGIGDWTEYGWDNAFDAQGHWTRGPLHGYVFLLRNQGTTTAPDYAEPVKLTAAGQPIDVFGMPSPNLADFDGDGDLDLLCGEFVDKFTYFQNLGTRKQPEFAAGKILTHNNSPITMDLEMIVPVALDWDKDGDVDLVVGQEDGRVAFMEHTGQVVDGIPQFLPPRFFQQVADELKFGALVTPVSFDWDHDGDEDLLCGNTAGYIGFIENLDGGTPPKWAAPQYLTANGEVIHIQAGYNGSIQGPAEAKWGYTTISVADWNHDGLPDILANSIWGRVIWFRNVGTREKPELTAAQPVEVEWSGDAPYPAWNWWKPVGKELVTQWRTTPFVYDLNHDQLNDLVMLDHEGYLAFFERIQTDGKLLLMPGQRIFYGQQASVFNGRHEAQNDSSGPLQLNCKIAGGSGRRKLCIADWDGDSHPDLLVNSENISLLRNQGDAKFVFENSGKLSEHILAGHTTSPTVVDWDKNGIPDLLIGAEDGFFYYSPNPRSN